jgi:ribonuclease I
MIYWTTLLIIISSLSTVFARDNCSSRRDYFFRYNKESPSATPEKTPSEYYVLQYSWSPNNCKLPGIKNRPGQPDFLQCGRGQSFGYVLDALIPRGASKSPVEPSYCEGDQPKIPQSILKGYLCMTPSLKKLQHNFEKYGTCLHDERIETPELYLETSYMLHHSLKMPSEKISASQENIQWWHDNNPRLKKGSIKFYNNRWFFCFNNDLHSIKCPQKEWQREEFKHRGVRSTRKTLNSFLRFTEYYKGTEGLN